MTKISFGYLVKWQVCCGVTLGLARGIFFSKVLYFFFSHFNGTTNSETFLQLCPFWSFSPETTTLYECYPNTNLIETIIFYRFYQTHNCDFQNCVFKTHILKTHFLKQLSQTDPKVNWFIYFSSVCQVVYN
jgi:hypothetical protein